METLIVSVVCIALLVVGGMTMSQGFLSSVDSSQVGLTEMVVKNEEIVRTELSILNVLCPESSRVNVYIGNTGQTKLSDFAGWDVIVQYYDAEGGYHVIWLPNTEDSLQANEWKVEGIYLDSGEQTPEVFEPGILNPGEEMIINAEVSPSVGEGTTNTVIVSTPNGVSTSAFFSR